MRPSSYNHIFENGDAMLMYNCASDNLLVLHPEVYRLFAENTEDLDVLRKKHKELYERMVQIGFIVNDDCDEYQAVLEKWKTEEATAKHFSITINPTLRCNMRCWYCYEDHENAGSMNEEVKGAIIRLVERTCQEKAFESIGVDFFGGEPLLCFRNVVRPILEASKECTEAHHKGLSVGFTSNAYLLTPEVVEFLKGYKVFFQITLDGDEATHDSIRHTVKKEATYRTIVGHIRHALRSGIGVVVRCNYTTDTLHSFANVLKDFQDLDEKDKEHLSFNFQQIWQNKGDGKEEAIQEQLKAMEHDFIHAGITVVPSSSNKVGRCYADNENNIVVNYDGHLFKCTARDFKKERSEGILLPDGEIQWYDRHARRRAVVFGGKACQTCNIFPICHGGCSQDKLEATEPDLCLRGYDEAQKQNFVLDRVNDLIALKRASMQKASQ